MKFEDEREELVNNLKNKSVVKSESLAQAMLNVPREEFMAEKYRDYAYVETKPFPIPPFTGNQTISAPNTYPMFYEPLNIQKGDKILEIGTGSGYGAAIAAELVGKKGKVVTIEKSNTTWEFAIENLEKSGYEVLEIKEGDFSREELREARIIVILGDGTRGFEPLAPYDKICVTASYTKIPGPLEEQLDEPGRLVMPIGGQGLNGQVLTLLCKDREGKLKKERLQGVVYVPLKGEHGH